MPRPPRAFFATSSPSLAPRLLGCTLVRVLNGRRLAGVIVEVEAYAGVQDTASHAFGGRRGPKNEAMYAQAGTSYVYFTYGMHFCLNIVCGRVNQPVAVLLRALEPVEGQGTMRAHRTSNQKKRLRDRDLCSGPGKLCQALAITRDQNHLDMTTSDTLFLELPKTPPKRSHITRAPRIGIGTEHAWADRPLRWLLHNNPHISAPPPLL